MKSKMKKKFENFFFSVRTYVKPNLVLSHVWEMKRCRVRWRDGEKFFGLNICQAKSGVILNSRRVRWRGEEKKISVKPSAISNLRDEELVEPARLKKFNCQGIIFWRFPNTDQMWKHSLTFCQKILTWRKFCFSLTFLSHVVNLEHVTTYACSYEYSKPTTSDWINAITFKWKGWAKSPFCRAWRKERNYFKESKTMWRLVYT